MTYFSKHLFVCTNQRDNGDACCQDAGAEALCLSIKKHVKSLGLAGKSKIRVSKSGCLGRCDEGPVLVVYPEGTWYTYHNQTDINEITEKHLLKGEIVERLLLDK